MLLIDSLDGQTIDHSYIQQGPIQTKNIIPVYNKSQRYKIPELNNNSKSLLIPQFQPISTFSDSKNELRFLKIVTRKDLSYQVLLNYQPNNKYLLIEVRPILDDLNTLKTSKYRLIHLLSYLSTINPNLYLFSFKMNALTREIYISASLVFTSSQNSLQKVNKIIAQSIELFQQKTENITTFVSKRGFTNMENVQLNESSEKYLNLVSQLLNNSCNEFSQLSNTSDIKKSKESCKNLKQTNHHRGVMLLPNSLAKPFIITKQKIRQKANKYDISRLLIPVKQDINNTTNHLCTKISFKQSNNIKWQSFCSNKNNKLEIANLNLQINNNHQQVTRWLIRKKPKTINGENQFQNTRKVYQCIKNKNCVNILQSYFTNQKSYQKSIFTDFCRYGSLSSFLKVNKNAISLRTKLYFMLQIAFSLQFLKNENIVHMDIKPSNFLVAPDLWIKLTDFGEATFYGDKSSRGWTPPYVAPERFLKTPADYSTDIYSFGVLMYEVITGKLLFSSRTSSFSKFSSEFEHKLPSTSFNPESFYCYGPQEIMIFMHFLIIKCVNPVSSMRPSVQEIILIFKSLIGLLQNLLVRN